MVGAASACSDDGGGDDAATTTAKPPRPGEDVVVELTADAVTPDGGDEGASGTATISFDDQAKKICAEVEVEGVEELGPVHLSRAPEGEEGPIVAELSDPTAKDRSKRFCAATQPAAVFDEVLDDPSGFYVVVRSRDFPLGALRGQLG
jgi:hypothetical protein